MEVVADVHGTPFSICPLFLSSQIERENAVPKGNVEPGLDRALQLPTYGGPEDSGKLDGKEAVCC